MPLHFIVTLNFVDRIEIQGNNRKTPALLSLNHIVCQIKKTNIQFYIELSLAISQFIQMVCATMRWNFSQQPSLNTFHQQLQLLQLQTNVFWIERNFSFFLFTVFIILTLLALWFFFLTSTDTYFSTPTYCITSRYMLSKLVWIFASDLLESWNALSFWYRQTRTRSMHEYKAIEWDND